MRGSPLRVLVLLAIVLTALVRIAATADAERFRFCVLGDRTGEAQPGIYEQVWREVAAENPAFVISVGDTIQGMHDVSAEAEWMKVEQLLKPYRRFPIYLTPGNHDIWSAGSEQLFVKHAGHAPRYSFDHGAAHFTILDNSRSEQFSAEDLAFLEKDLKAHEAQPAKFIFSHRPSWLMNVALRNPNFTLHQLARKYKVQYVIAGHVHQMLRFELEGVTYLSMASSGGHLRASQDYVAGWFFAHSLVEVRGPGIHFQIEELKPPHGSGRVTQPTDWGMLGLLEKSKAASAPGTAR